MPLQLSRSARRTALFLALLTFAACGSDKGSTGIVDPPVISVAGVADGVSYPGAVTLTFASDKGSYSATLNGQPVTSGATVQAPGTHILVVTARVDGVATTKTVTFTIQGATGGMLIIRMIDLGTRSQDAPGDAILVTDSSAAGMMHALIDAGPGLTTNSNAFVASRLTALRVDSLAMMVLTHAHTDHFGGMSSVLTTQDVKRFIYSGQIRTLSTYTSTLAQAAVSADSVIKVTTQREYPLGYASQPSMLRILPPLQTWINTNTSDGDELNEGSVGAHLSMGSFDMFFTGDSEVLATARWRTQFADLSRDLSVLKVGHHGANNAIFDNGFNGTATWIDHTSPNVSIISANGTSHPRINALNRLLGQPENVTYCTNVHGTITIRVTRTGTYTVTTEKNANMNCVAGSTATT